ncbi:MAG TPA: SDR family oxidoreductase [Alphaproteobacteria bacterium]|nr:SDR family oxidoreductase [Alphaproteobacteria bacterium]
MLWFDALPSDAASCIRVADNEQGARVSGTMSGRVVLVTGASAGIGRATAAEFARRGARVIATGRRQGELDALARECRGIGEPIETIAGDLNDPAFARVLAERAKAADIFVNNAGVLTYAPILDLADADSENMFRTNVLAALRMTQHVARAMVARGSGHIIFVTSLAAREVYRLGVVYAATKHALSAIARGLRLEVQAHGIRVTEVAPGTVETGIRDSSTHPAVLAAAKARAFTPLTPAEVAAAILFAAETPDNCCPELIELRPKGAVRG